MGLLCHRAALGLNYFGSRKNAFNSVSLMNSNLVGDIINVLFCQKYRNCYFDMVELRITPLLKMLHDGNSDQIISQVQAGTPSMVSIIFKKKCITYRMFWSVCRCDSLPNWHILFAFKHDDFHTTFIVFEHSGKDLFQCIKYVGLQLMTS